MQNENASIVWIDRMQQLKYFRCAMKRSLAGKCDGLFPGGAHSEVRTHPNCG